MINNWFQRRTFIQGTQLWMKWRLLPRLPGRRCCGWWCDAWLQGRSWTGHAGRPGCVCQDQRTSKTPSTLTVLFPFLFPARFNTCNQLSTHNRKITQIRKIHLATTNSEIRTALHTQAGTVTCCLGPHLSLTPSPVTWLPDPCYFFNPRILENNILGYRLSINCFP